MTTHEKDTFLQTYQWAKEWSQLPWAHEEPTLFLAEICQQQPAGRALDIGCGTGTDSVYLATRGWEVTALDFVPRALEFTQQRAQQAGASVTPVEADITSWEVPHEFDLVLDHGLLHNMDPARYPAYRERVMQALSDHGDFLLLHWHPLFPGQANGKVGPNRRSREEIKDFFAPELAENFFAREDFEDLPDMVGGGMAQAYYWFRRHPVQAHPDQLMAQLYASLARHDIQVSADAVIDDALLARIVGPGRLGLTHRIPAAADATAVIDDWAVANGQDAWELRQMIQTYASAEYANVCTGTPRCQECDVIFCKRQRAR